MCAGPPAARTWINNILLINCRIFCPPPLPFRRVKFVNVHKMLVFSSFTCRIKCNSMMYSSATRVKYKLDTGRNLYLYPWNYFTVFLTFCWPCISVYLSQYLTNLMHKLLFYNKFISYLYMFRAHMLIIRRSKFHYTASGIITPIGVKQKFCASSWLITEINTLLYWLLHFRVWLTHYSQFRNYNLSESLFILFIFCTSLLLFYFISYYTFFKISFFLLAFHILCFLLRIHGLGV